MPRKSGWTLGGKLVTFAVVAFLLSIGLCSQGSFEVGTPFRRDLTAGGIYALLAAVVLLISGCIVLVIERIHEDDR
jgi:hypothetical protein